VRFNYPKDVKPEMGGGFSQPFALPGHGTVDVKESKVDVVVGGARGVLPGRLLEGPLIPSRQWTRVLHRGGVIVWSIGGHLPKRGWGAKKSVGSCLPSVGGRRRSCRGGRAAGGTGGGSVDRRRCMCKKAERPVGAPVAKGARGPRLPG
jgi:hypothetical protein